MIPSNDFLFSIYIGNPCHPFSWHQQQIFLVILLKYFLIDPMHHQWRNALPSIILDPEKHVLWDFLVLSPLLPPLFFAYLTFSHLHSTVVCHIMQKCTNCCSSIRFVLYYLFIMLLCSWVCITNSFSSIRFLLYYFIIILFWGRWCISRFWSIFSSFHHLYVQLFQHFWLLLWAIQTCTYQLLV